jgi:putative lipoprotein
MSLKSFLPAAAALAVATVALTGCTQTANVSGGDSSAPAASSAPEASSNPRTDTKSDAPKESGKSDAPKESGKSDASGTFTIDESNAHVEIPAGTKTVVINGSNNHIQGHEVTEIKINGSANAVEVDSVKTVSFTGSNNAVQYEDGAAPQTASDSGANNAVTKG